MVLSACETGVGGDLGGELAGLAQAFLQAGARSLVVSLWEVDDETTGALMSTFHARCRAGDDSASALARAMEEARAASRTDESYTWGGFIQIGDWRANRPPAGAGR
jgi:CHAT domain-containing protein